MNQYLLPVHRIEAIKDDVVPAVVDGFGVGNEVLDELTTDCPVVYSLGASGQTMLPLSKDVQELRSTDSKLVQLSVNHGRSFEVVDPRLPRTWRDEHGHVYGSLNLKGNNFSLPTLIETMTASEGVTAYGLQESVCLQRIVRASQVLREAGVSTERILAVAEPKYFPLALLPKIGIDYHTHVEADVYKRSIIKNYWEGLPTTEQTIDKLAELHGKLDKMAFFITARAMDTSYRLGEFSESLEAREAAYEVAQTLGFNEKRLDPLDMSDSYEFLADFVAPRLGKNLARMHNAGLVHRFLTEFNITALGSPVDLDSLHGEALDLGDEPVTAEDVYQDLVYAMASLQSVSFLPRVLARTGGKDIVGQLLEAYNEELLSLGDTGRALQQSIVNVAADRIGIKQQPDYLHTVYPAHYEGYYANNLVRNLSSPPQEISQEEFMELFSRAAKERLAEHVVEDLGSIIEEFGGLLISENVDELLSKKTVPRKGNAVTDEYFYDRVLEAVARRLAPSPHLMQSVYDYIYQHGLPDEHIAESIITGFESTYADALDEYLTVKTLPPLLGADYPSDPRIQSHGNIFACDTSGVPLRVLHSYLQQNPTVPVKYRSFDGIHATWQPVDEQSVLSEILTDTALDLLSSDIIIVYDLQIECERGASYAAFVEYLADGTLSLQINLKGYREGMDANELQALLQKQVSPTQYIQGTLFNVYELIMKQFNFVTRPEA